MIAVYLRAELESDRFGSQLRGLLARVGRELGSADAAYRRRLLDEHRGYGSRTGMFGGFPRDMDWYRASLTRDEVLDILVHRLHLVDRAVGRDASPARRGPAHSRRQAHRHDGRSHGGGARTVPGVDVRADRRHHVHAREARRRRSHARLTAYALFPERVPEDVEIVLGVSDEVAT